MKKVVLGALSLCFAIVLSIGGNESKAQGEGFEQGNYIFEDCEVRMSNGETRLGGKCVSNGGICAVYSSCG